jgi:hypothetical protein
MQIFLSVRFFESVCILRLNLDVRRATKDSITGDVIAETWVSSGQGDSKREQTRPLIMLI